MDFSISEEDKLLQTSVRDFIEEQVNSRWREIEEKKAIPDGIIEMKVNAATGGKKDADLDPVFEYFRTDMLPSDEGYVGDTGINPQSIEGASPDSPQGGTDPIF